ncbi:MAG: hypothetical protein PF505_03740 [Vallitaleaceae bacterium]|jgi:hypothetical protein|nr:hypothetical protein [Vallitaleaceae bacterium]
MYFKSMKFFSNTHIQSAALSARLAYQCEQEHSDDTNSEVQLNHMIFVINAIISSVSYLEANINELFVECSENKTGFKSNLRTNMINDSVIEALERSWKLGVPRTAKFSILNKYDIALALAGIDSIDKSTSVYENADTLIKLRNSLVHYEPEWINDYLSDSELTNKMAKRLKGKFDLNPLTGEGNPFYPDKCLSHGCAEWAVKTSLEYVDNFSSMFGFIPRHSNVDSHLGTR